MNKSKIIILLSAVFLLAGCSQSRWAREEAVKRESRQTFDSYYKLKAAGLKDDYGIYEKSEFAKTNDVAGYIKFRNDQRRQKEEEPTRIYKQAIPSLSEAVRSCVLKSGTPEYYRKSPSTCFNQLPYAQRAPLVDKRLGIIPDYRIDEVIGPISKELEAAHDERASQEWTDTVMRLRAADRRKVAAQKEAAKRAYENSIQSLVE
jgi:hypothetical protein